MRGDLKMKENKKLVNETVVLTVIRTDGSTYPKVVTYEEFDKLCREV